MQSIVNLARVTPHKHQFKDIDGYIGVEEDSGIILSGDGRRVSFVDFTSISPAESFKNILLKGKKAQLLNNIEVLAGSASSVSDITVYDDILSFTVSGAASISFTADFHQDLKSLFGVIIESDIQGVFSFSGTLSSGETLDETISFAKGKTSKVLYDFYSDVTLDVGEKAFMKFTTEGDGHVRVKFYAMLVSDRQNFDKTHNYLSVDGSEILPSNTYTIDQQNYIPGTNETVDMPLYSLSIPDANTNRALKEFKLYNSGDFPLQLGELWFSPSVNYEKLAEVLYCGVKTSTQSPFDHPSEEREYTRANGTITISLNLTDTSDTIIDVAIRFTPIDTGTYTIYSAYDNLTTYPHVIVYNEVTKNVVADSGEAGYSFDVNLDGGISYMVVFKGARASLSISHISFKDIKIFLSSSPKETYTNWVTPSSCYLLTEKIGDLTYFNTYDVLSGLFTKNLDMINFAPEFETTISKNSGTTTIQAPARINPRDLGILDSNFILYTNNFEKRYPGHISDGKIILEGLLEDNFYNGVIVFKCEPEKVYTRGIPDFKFLDSSAYIELSCAATLSYWSTDTTTKTVTTTPISSPLVASQKFDFCYKSTGFNHFNDLVPVYDVICPDDTDYGYVKAYRSPSLISIKHQNNNISRRSIPLVAVFNNISSEAVVDYYNVYLSARTTETILSTTANYDWMMITNSGAIQQLNFRRSSLKYDDVLDSYFIKDINKLLIRDRSFEVDSLSIGFKVPSTLTGSERVIIKGLIIGEDGVNSFVWNLKFDFTTKAVLSNTLFPSDIGLNVKFRVTFTDSPEYFLVSETKNIKKVIFDEVFVFHPAAELVTTDIEVYSKSIDTIDPSELNAPYFQSTTVPLYKAQISILEAEWESSTGGSYSRELSVNNLAPNAVVSSVNASVWDCGDISFTIDSSGRLVVSTYYPGNFEAEISFYIVSL